MSHLFKNIFETISLAKIHLILTIVGINMYPTLGIFGVRTKLVNLTSAFTLRYGTFYSNTVFCVCYNENHCLQYIYHISASGLTQGSLVCNLVPHYKSPTYQNHHHMESP